MPNHKRRKKKREIVNQLKQYGNSIRQIIPTLAKHNEKNEVVKVVSLPLSTSLTHLQFFPNPLLLRDVLYEVVRFLQADKRDILSLSLTCKTMRDSHLLDRPDIWDKHLFRKDVLNNKARDKEGFFTIGNNERLTNKLTINGSKLIFGFPTCIHVIKSYCDKIMNHGKALPEQYQPHQVVRSVRILRGSIGASHCNNCMSTTCGGSKRGCSLIKFSSDDDDSTVFIDEFTVEDPIKILQQRQDFSVFDNLSVLNIVISDAEDAKVIKLTFYKMTLLKSAIVIFDTSRCENVKVDENNQDDSSDNKYYVIQEWSCLLFSQFFRPIPKKLKSLVVLRANGGVFPNLVNFPVNPEEYVHVADHFRDLYLHDSDTIQYDMDRRYESFDQVNLKGNISMFDTIGRQLDTLIATVNNVIFDEDIMIAVSRIRNLIIGYRIDR